MDIISFSEDLLRSMKAKIEVLSTESQDLAATAQVIGIVKGATETLMQELSRYTFPSKQEEIQFFKEIKPVFLSQYRYYSKMFSIKTFETFNTIDNRKGYYIQTLKQLEEFATRNKDFYIYAMSNATYLDEQYFLRSTERFFSGHAYGTLMDGKLARMLANEMLKKYLEDAVSHSCNLPENTSLKWTASKTALIELGIALHAAGSFNNSNADAKEIFSAFERLFNVDLKDHYRIFLQIKERKKGQTAFLDQLRERLLQKIEEVDKI